MQIFRLRESCYFQQMPAIRILLLFKWQQGCSPEGTLARLVWGDGPRASEHGPREREAHSRTRTARNHAGGPDKAPTEEVGQKHRCWSAGMWMQTGDTRVGLPGEGMLPGWAALTGRFQPHAWTPGRLRPWSGSSNMMSMSFELFFVWEQEKKIKLAHVCVCVNVCK